MCILNNVNINDMSDNKVDFTGFFQTKLRKDLISDVETVDGLLKSRKLNDSVKKVVEENKEDILFRFKGSFIVGSNFLIGTSKKEGGRKIDFSQLSNITYKDGGIFGVSGYFINDKHFDNYIENPSSGKRLFKLFKEYINQSIFSEVDNNETGKIDNTFNQELENSDDLVSQSRMEENEKPTNKDSLNTNPTDKLIKFIEICLTDGEISDKEREVIFRKSKEIGVPDDECEIIIQSLIQKLNKSGDNDLGSNEDLSHSFDKENILSLDKNLLVNFSDYLNNLEEQLDQLYNSDRINKTFTDWYKNVGSKIEETHEKNSYNSIEKEVFIKDKNDRKEKWEKVKIIHIKLSTDKNTRVVYMGKGWSGRDLFFTDEQVHYISERKGLFISKGQVQIDKSIRIEDIDITDFESQNVDDLYFLLRVFWNMGFLNENKILDNCLTKLKSNFSFDIGLSVSRSLPNTTIFGDDLVIKLINHISKLIENLNKELNNYQKDDLIPISDYGWGKIGYNQENLKRINYIIYSIKNISGLVSLKNQLLYFVLTENRSSILMIKEQMDDLGILLTHYQREKLEKLDELVNTLKKGFQMISGTLDKISSQLENLDTSINQGNQQIKERLEFNNLLTGIQTYQLYKINKNTKSLRG